MHCKLVLIMSTAEQYTPPVLNVAPLQDSPGVILFGEAAIREIGRVCADETADKGQPVFYFRDPELARKVLTTEEARFAGRVARQIGNDTITLAKSELRGTFKLNSQVHVLGFIAELSSSSRVPVIQSRLAKRASTLALRAQRYDAVSLVTSRRGQRFVDYADSIDQALDQSLRSRRRVA
jgi:hypothetical protein